MNIFEIIYFLTGITTSIFLFIFACYIFIEKYPKSSLKLIILAVIFLIYWIYSPPLLTILYYINFSFLTIFIVLLFAPIGKSKPIKINYPENEAMKFDERDTMFARADLKSDTNDYNEYYKIHPDKKNIDDKIRSMPELLEIGGKFYDPVKSNYVKSLFKIESSRINEVDGEVNSNITQLSKSEATKMIKEKILHQGAEEVGIAKLNQNYVYSHQARGTSKWGEEIHNNHKYVIVFTVEMDYDKVYQAPNIEITEETALKYLEAQKISIALASYIRELGYSARSHISGSNYQIILPAVAYDAGLGELSRMNFLISKKHGPRVRLGAVTTDLELNIDKKVNLGVQDFCDICKKCAMNCPSNAISEGAKVEIKGVEKWKLGVESCYKYWRHIGTDCGICMKVCPFSHPNNWIHNIFRFSIKNSKFARRISVWGDDLIYGKNYK